MARLARPVTPACDRMDEHKAGQRQSPAILLNHTAGRKRLRNYHRRRLGSSSFRKGLKYAINSSDCPLNHVISSPIFLLRFIRCSDPPAKGSIAYCAVEITMACLPTSRRYLFRSSLNRNTASAVPSVYALKLAWLTLAVLV